MLFHYKYVNHSVEKMQQYIDYIFYEVWCNAPFTTYDLSLFKENSELYDIMIRLSRTTSKFPTFVKEIYDIFSTLGPENIQLLKEWYEINNNIVDLCNNTTSPVTYVDIFTLNEDLSILKDFFDYLYDHSFNSVIINSYTGDFLSHYQELMRTNRDISMCPFCGLSPLENFQSSNREEYDHYLPKGQYPFISVNFKNLAPMCHKCNKDHKFKKNPLRDSSDNLRKSFYIYEPHQDLEIKIILNSSSIDNLTTSDISIIIGPESLHDEIKTWSEIFNIEERYKLECCGPEMQYDFVQIFDESNSFGMELTTYLSLKLDELRLRPYHSKNFLKISFLEACLDLNLFNNI